VPTDDKLLTDAELAHMRALWDVGEGGGRDVQAALPPGEGDRAYTTTASILKILQTKGFAKSRRQGRALVWRPAVARDAYQARSVRHVVDTVFEGDAVGLVRQLVQERGVDADTLAAMRALVEELEP
jgi:predicted transcriptional regulator